MLDIILWAITLTLSGIILYLRIKEELDDLKNERSETIQENKQQSDIKKASAYISFKSEQGEAKISEQKNFEIQLKNKYLISRYKSKLLAIEPRLVFEEPTQKDFKKIYLTFKARKNIIAALYQLVEEGIQPHELEIIIKTLIDHIRPHCTKEEIELIEAYEKLQTRIQEFKKRRIELLEDLQEKRKIINERKNIRQNNNSARTKIVLEEEIRENVIKKAAKELSKEIELICKLT